MPRLPRLRLVAASSVAGALAVTCAPASAVPTYAAGRSPSSRGAAAAPASYASAVNVVQRDSYYPQHGDDRLDALHYGLRLHWAARKRLLTGRATVELRVQSATEHLLLDLSDRLTVTSVSLDGRAAGFAHGGDRIDVDAGDTLLPNTRHTLVIAYRGTPKPVASPTNRSDIDAIGWHTTKRNEVWTLQEPFGAFTWYPVNDQPSDKAFYDLRISAPRGMVGISNGSLKSRHVSLGRTVTRWHLGSPAASYLVTLTIGDYAHYRDTGPHGLPISYWLPRRDTSALAELRRTPAMLAWLEKRLGRYPFSRAGAVVVPSSSAMETQTLVTMGSRLLREGGHRTFRADLLHEYAHQWYGDVVTPDDWRDLWLNESFAMYVQLRWEIDHGWETRKAVIRELDTLDADLRKEDGPPGAYDARRFGSSCVYYCGARMLFRLRTRIGGEAFDTLLSAWPQRQRFQTGDRATYAAFADRIVGSDAGVPAFLDHWLTSPTSPP